MATIITDWAQWLSGQTAASGALAILYCATAPELEGMWRMGEASLGGLAAVSTYAGHLASTGVCTPSCVTTGPDKHLPRVPSRRGAWL